MKMKFNYEFEFDVEEFANWLEEGFFEYTKERTFYGERDDKAWIADKLYDWCGDTEYPSILIISTDIEDDTKKYYPQIVDKAYEILKERYNEKEEEEKEKEIMKHLRIISDYCEEQCDCFKCPIQKICESGTIGSWRLNKNEVR